MQFLLTDLYLISPKNYYNETDLFSLYNQFDEEIKASC